MRGCYTQCNIISGNDKLMFPSKTQTTHRRSTRYIRGASLCVWPQNIIFHNNVLPILIAPAAQTHM